MRWMLVRIILLIFISSAPLLAQSEMSQRPNNMVWIPGGEFLMGSTSPLSQPNERPAHKVKVSGFWMDKTDVTNAQFAAFVKATGYVTTAEQKPSWESLKVQLPPEAKRP